MGKELINLSNLQRFLSKLSEKFALKKAMKGISEDSEGNIIIGEEGLVPTPDENSKGKFLRSDGEWALPSETAVYDSMTIEEGVAGVSKVDRVINAKNLKQIVNSDGFLTSLDSSKLTGVINIENLPQGALERILIVSSKEERLTLSDTEVQLGDVVKEADTGLMYYVINTEKLNSEEGYTQFTAGSASSVPWSGVTNKPTIPTKTSELTNDSDFAIDNDVVHKTSNETIAGNKTFSNQIYLGGGGTSYGIISAKDNNSTLRLFGGASVVTGANLDLYGEGLESGKFSLRARNSSTMIGLDGSTDGSLTWGGKSLAIDENLVHRSGNETIGGTKTFSSKIVGNLQGNADTATSANDPNAVHRSGDETIDGTKTFTNDKLYIKNSDIDLTITPTSNEYSQFFFTDKNKKSLSLVQYAQRSTDVNDLDLYVYDKNSTAHGIQITTDNELSPIGNNYSLGSSNGHKWANVYATTFNGNLKGNADTATKAVNSDYAGSSTKATQDSAGQQINKTYIKELSVSGRTITYKRGDNTTGTITTQDTNTTYSKLSQFTNDTGFITSSGSCKYATSAGSAGNGIDISGAGYIKFKDGTQICWGANKDGDIATFANAFKSIPYISFGYNITTDIDGVIHGQAKNSSSTSFTMQVWNLTQNTRIEKKSVDWIAIGRWK